MEMLVIWIEQSNCYSREKVGGSKAHATADI